MIRAAALALIFCASVSSKLFSVDSCISLSR